MSSERYTDRWTVGQWTFYQIEDHPFGNGGQPLYGFGPAGSVRSDGRPETKEWYPSLEHAMAAAIAEKYTGARGAGGTGVGTAADWFMRMIGADAVTALSRTEAEKAMREAQAGALAADKLRESAEDGLSRQEKHRRREREVRWALDELEARGVMLAAVNHGR